MKRFLSFVVVLLAALFLMNQTVWAQRLYRPFKKRQHHYHQQAAMTISKTPFGTTKDGREVDLYTLSNGWLTVKVLNYGGIIYSFDMPDKEGNSANISANLESIADYEKNRPFFGALVGRYGNRIAKGKFTLDGKEYTLPKNNGPNSLHGGIKGFDTVIWEVKEFKTGRSVGLQLSYTAQDGEEGYPGKLDVTVVYELNSANEWKMDYTAKTDKATVVNLTNHTFWNLSGFKSTILNHELLLNADAFLPTDGTLIPTGEIKKVDGTPLDFRKSRVIGERIGDIKEKAFHGGYDHCFVLNREKRGGMSLCAELYDPDSGRAMKVSTTEPGVQCYSGNFLDGKLKAFGHRYVKHDALCLETQHFPDSPNKPDFPSTVLRPGETYRHTTVHQFSVRKK